MEIEIKTFNQHLKDMNLEQAKGLFFSQYLWQKVFNDGGGEYLYALTPDFLNKIHEQHYLLLRTVEQLTDEEYVELAKHSAYRLTDKNKVTIGKVMLKHLFGFNKWSGNLCIALNQYLLRIGILLPFTYLSDENKPITLQPAELINMGWVKIKETN